MMHSRMYLLLLFIAFLVYSSAGIFTKLASMQEPFSNQYTILIALALTLMGLYAVMWQYALRRIPLSQAYLYKSITIVFTLLFAYEIFKENISLNNVVGCVLIFLGVILNSNRKFA